ncbi:MAG: NAD(P)H-dependent oxidoreductase [Firmicutes bacterium]|nr:NAD(P)H-dependent oxidoreductase [Bacillota bacterium]
MKLLFIDACLRGEKSRTKIICEKVIGDIKAQYKNIDVETVDLKSLPIKALFEEDLARRDALIEKGDLSDFGLAKQFADADIIVVGAPYWDLSFPAALKVYIENIAVNTIAFHYTEHGQEGLCKAEKAYYVTTGGGYMQGAEFGYQYIKGVFGLFGIKDVSYIGAEGLDIWGNDVDKIIEETIKGITVK